MIVKRIRKGARQARGSVARVVASVVALSRYVVDADPWAMAEFERVRSLTDYALHVEAHAIEPGEKVEAAGAFNLHGHDLSVWQMEMAAIAARAPRSRDPLEHFVYSWHEGENPTPAQVEEAGAILLEVLGYGACPAIWSFHTNTAQKHGHLAVVRVDPATGRVAGDRWDVDRAHQAIALIEERQRWASEPNALYVARSGEVYDRATGQKVRDRDGLQIGRRSAKPLPPKIARIAIAIRQAALGSTDWTDLHARMAALGATFRQKGSGAVIAVGEDEAKASQIHNGCALAQLTKRLGAFEPDPSAHGYETYKAAGRQQLTQIRSVHAQERERLKAWLGEMLAGLGHGAHPALAMAIRAEYASTLADLDAAFATSKSAFAAARLLPHQWEGGGRPTIPSALPMPTLLIPAAASRERTVVPPARLHPHHVGWRTDYHDDAGTKLFSDLRHVIVIHNFEAEGIDAALRLAAERWGTLRIHASEAGTRIIAERAAAIGIATVDADGRHLSSYRPMPPVLPKRFTEQRPQVTPQPAPAFPLPQPPEQKRAPRNGSLPEKRPETPNPVPSVESDISYEVQLAWLAGRSRSLPPGVG